MARHCAATRPLLYRRVKAALDGTAFGIFLRGAILEESGKGHAGHDCELAKHNTPQQIDQR
jgi:hypothetical protein